MDTSRRSALKLDALVKDLLDVSKIEGGHLQLHKTRFNLASLIHECCDHVRLHGTHTLLVKGDLDLEVVADKQCIDQVIVNFVNNAIKYGPKSQEIILLIQREDAKARISVTDKGIGIENSKLPYLFNRFYRVEETGLQYSGLGLGLYICAEIVRLHEGEIGVISEEGKGSEFWFTIPLGESTTMAAK